MSRIAAALRLGVALALAAALAGSGHAVASQPSIEPAPGGADLLAALEEGGGIAVVGRVGDVRRLDTHGYSARIWVERVLGPQADRYGEGDPLRFAWEELASGRPPRFGESERVLVVLERLGTASIWRRRIADPSLQRQTLGVAADGDAFLRDPAPGGLDALHHYLSIPPAERDGPAGAGYLAGLAAAGQLPLAVSAARRLQTMKRLNESLGEDGEAALVAALERDDAEPALAAALLPVLARVTTSSFEKRLSRRAGKPEPPAPARIFRALAISRAGDASGRAGLEEDELSWLLARPEADYRLVAAQSAGPGDDALLRELRAQDPDAGVRATALLQLVALLGAEALDEALASLADPAPAVRAAAARSAAAFGDAAVPALQEIAFGRHEGCCDGSADASRAAIAGLRLAGPAGRRALAQVARDHPDPALRKLADLALGELDAHAH